MSDEQVNRRLAAIIAADVAGYSRLTSASEEATLAAMRAHRRAARDAHPGAAMAPAKAIARSVRMMGETAGWI